MNQELLQRIPRIPHWRWILFSGAGHPDWSEAIAQLDRYVKEEGLDVGLSGLSEPTEDSARAVKIYLSEPPIKKTIEAMLFERCSVKLIADALYHKFKEPISDNVVRQYRKFFYDVEVINNYEMAKYYETKAQNIPKAPPVPGHMKEQYIAFKHGVETSLDVQKVLNHMLQASFFRSQELQQYGWVADDKVLKYQKNTMDLIKTMKDGGLDIPIPDEFNYEVEYPNATAVSMTGLGDYDPADDPNAEDIRDDE